MEQGLCRTLSPACWQGSPRATTAFWATLRSVSCDNLLSMSIAPSLGALTFSSATARGTACLQEQATLGLRAENEGNQHSRQMSYRADAQTHLCLISHAADPGRLTAKVHAAGDSTSWQHIPTVSCSLRDSAPANIFAICAAHLTAASPYCRRWSNALPAIADPRSSPMATRPMPITAAL